MAGTSSDNKVTAHERGTSLGTYITGTVHAGVCKDVLEKLTDKEGIHKMAGWLQSGTPSTTVAILHLRHKL